MASIAESQNDCITLICEDWKSVPVTAAIKEYYTIAVGIHSWANIQEIKNFVNSKGATIVSGPRDNRTDGEIEWIVTKYDGERGKLNGNCWSGGTFIPLLMWLDKPSKIN